MFKLWIGNRDGRVTSDKDFIKKWDKEQIK